MKAHAQARKFFAAAADEFDQLRLDPVENAVAAEGAAASRFHLAEYELEKFDRIQIYGTGDARAKIFATMRAAVVSLRAAYDAVARYKRDDWTVVAAYRKDYVLDRFEQSIVEAPIPIDVRRTGRVAEYQRLLRPEPAALIKTVSSYAATLEAARAHKVPAIWTERIVESLEQACSACAKHGVQCPCD